MNDNKKANAGLIIGIIALSISIITASVLTYYIIKTNKYIEESYYEDEDYDYWEDDEDYYDEDYYDEEYDDEDYYDEDEEYEENGIQGSTFDLNHIHAEIAYKPIIYLYPTQEQTVSVKLEKPDNITYSYPKYIDGWNVIAQPNGDLKYIDNDRGLYSLYYECNNDIAFRVEKDGFVIKGEDTVSFLEEKLAVLGLTEREAEEFIVYWLPKLEANKYNYIRFATMDEINKNMPIKIEPNPDTIIRVLMTFKGLDKLIEVHEQQLETPERTGFVAVEWGGSEIK